MLGTEKMNGKKKELWNLTVTFYFFSCAVSAPLLLFFLYMLYINWKCLLFILKRKFSISLFLFSQLFHQIYRQCACYYQQVLVLGREKEGIPVDIIHILDACIEIPQLGVVRSLNVHVSGAIALWEYTRQQRCQ